MSESETGGAAGPVATVIVPTRDRPDDLGRLLPTIAAQETARTFEVVVIDDGSSPAVDAGPIEALPGGRVLRTGGMGPARARNAGAAAARGDYLLFTDDDTELAPGWVEAACSFLDAHPDHVGVQGPVTSPPFDPLYEHSLESDAPGAFWTCNIAYRRSAFEELRGFHEEFPDPHCEDLDLGYRAEGLGPVGFDRGMTIVHHPRPLPLRGFYRRGSLAPSESVLFERHRDRFGHAARLPARLYPLSNALYNWTLQARREGSSLRSPRRLARFLAAASVFIAAVVVATVKATPQSRP